MSRTYQVVAIADVGGPATNHVGDESMLEADLARLRRCLPSLSFTALSGDPHSRASDTACGLYRARARLVLNWHAQEMGWRVLKTFTRPSSEAWTRSTRPSA